MKLSLFQSEIAAHAVRLFISAIKRGTIKLIDENVERILVRCNEFHFRKVSQGGGNWRKKILDVSRRNIWGRAVYEQISNTSICFAWKLYEPEKNVIVPEKRNLPSSPHLKIARLSRKNHLLSNPSSISFQEPPIPTFHETLEIDI
jgi:hypothetical protein